MQILCPYCSKSFPASAVEYQCENKERKATGEELCPSVEDEKLSDYWGKSGLLYKRFFTGRVFPIFSFGQNRKVQACNCPGCGIPSTHVVCPNCHNPLPTEMIEEGSEVISIIGDRSSGKTVYLVSLIRQMVQHGYRLGFHQTTPLDLSYDEETRTSKIYDKLYEDMFQDHILPGQNRAVRPAPLIFKISSKPKGSKKGRTIYLSFYDTAGEIFRDSAKMNVLAKYLQNSAGIILLIDPIKVEGLQKTLVEGGILSTPETHTVDPVIIFDKLDEIKGKEKIREKPVALTYSKIDLVVQALANQGNLYQIPGMVLEQNSSFLQTGKFDLAEVDAIDQGMREAATRWGNANVISRAVATFGEDNVRLFGVSALGCPLDKNGTISKLSPYRVMDPLVWILHKMGGFDIPVVNDKR